MNKIEHDQEIFDLFLQDQSTMQIEILGKEIIKFYYDTRDQIEKINKLIEEIIDFSP